MYRLRRKHENKHTRHVGRVPTFDGSDPRDEQIIMVRNSNYCETVSTA